MAEIDSLSVTLQVTVEHWEIMKTEVARCFPREGCGLIAGRFGRAEAVIPMKNVAERSDRFLVEPVELVRFFNWVEMERLDLIGIFHSHPFGPQTPSLIDIEDFAYPGVISVIWFPGKEDWSARAYLIQNETYQDVFMLRV
jgi:proteasome lid subunit RPN8/RPN11